MYCRGIALLRDAERTTIFKDNLPLLLPDRIRNNHLVSHRLILGILARNPTLVHQGALAA